MRLKRLGIVLLLLLLLVAERAVGYEPVQEYTPPYEVTDKDLNPLYGRYEIYEADKYRGGATTAAEAQAWVGQELIVTTTLYRQPNLRIENPTYTVWYYPDQPEGNVPSRSERWSSFYILDRKQTVGDEIIEVYKPGGGGPWLYLEIIGTNELWVGFSGWYYKARKTTRPVLSAGHDDYCQVMGPCSVGQGDCDSDSECQSELTCVDGRMGGTPATALRRMWAYVWPTTTATVLGALPRTDNNRRPASDCRMGQVVYCMWKVGLHSPPMSSYSSSRHR